MRQNERLKTIQNYVGGCLHPAKWIFVLPHTSVPACLTSKALWVAFISWSFGPETSVSNATRAICGATAGLLFGGNSLYGAASGTNKLLREIDITITDILNAMHSLPGGVKQRLNKQIENIPTKPQFLSWSQIVNVAFAWYTATITSFTFSGAVRDAVKSEPCVPNKPCSDTYPAFPIVATLAVLWGVCALLLAYYGQREQAFLTRVNNALKDLINNNPELSAQINNVISSRAPVAVVGMFAPSNDDIDSERTEKSSLLKSTK